MGAAGIEPATSRLSAVRSDQLSYTPSWVISGSSSADVVMFSFMVLILWCPVTGSNRRPSSCKEAALPTELTGRESVGPSPGTRRRTHADDVEGRVRIELTKTGVAIRRLTIRHPARVAGRQRIELCPLDLESGGPTRKRPVRSEARTETPEWSDDGEYAVHDLISVEAEGLEPSTPCLQDKRSPS